MSRQPQLQQTTAPSNPGRGRVLLGQLLKFGLIGAVQFGLDAGFYAVLVSLWGWPVSSNLASRAVAACAGFWLNSRWTFRGSGDAPGRLSRYLALWVLMTALSTGMIALFKLLSGEDRYSQAYILFKIGLEVALSLFSFLLMRAWIFRR